MTSELVLSAVYVFDLGKGFRQADFTLPRGFSTDFPERSSMALLGERMFAPERSARLEQVYASESGAAEVTLSNGKLVSFRPLRVFASIYSAGIGVLTVRLEAKARLMVNELIELAALAKGTYERMAARTDAQVVINVEDRTYTSFFQMYGELANQIRSGIGSISKQMSTAVFTCPVLYVRSMAGGVKSSEEMERRFPRQLTALAQMWMNNWQWVKAKYIKENLLRECHPLSYGYTHISPICTYEFHPSLVEAAAAAEERSLDYHHFVEWFNLLKTVEILSVQYFALRRFDAEISELEVRTDWSATAVVFNPLRHLLSAIQLSRERQRIMSAIDDFWNIRLTRRRYVWEVFEYGKQEFLVDRAYGAAKEKIETLEKNITSLFSMLTTVFVLVLAIAALFVGALQLESQLSAGGEHTVVVTVALPTVTPTSTPIPTPTSTPNRAPSSTPKLTP